MGGKEMEFGSLDDLGMIWNGFVMVDETSKGGLAK